MTNAYSPHVYEAVQRCVAESLAVPLAEVLPTSHLIDDLGADSLDLVDIVFMLERELGISVKESEFNFLTRLDFSSPAIMKEGFLTDEVVEKLVDWLPAMRELPDKTRITPRKLFSLVTIESICIVAQRRVDGRPAAGTPP